MWARESLYSQRKDRLSNDCFGYPIGTRSGMMARICEDNFAYSACEVPGHRVHSLVNLQKPGLVSMGIGAPCLTIIS